MIPNKTAKLIKSLHQKKYRIETGYFLVEGAKSVREMLYSNYTIETLVFTKGFLETLNSSSYHKINTLNHFQIAPDKLKALSTLKNNQMVLAVAKSKPNTPIQIQQNEYGIVLDDINDPGNLGTILRIADWFGISKIICSNNTTEIYNPKVISASMGSFLRVQTYYTSLADYLSKHSLPVLGTYLEGTNIHKAQFAPEGLLLMGNESNGIHPDLEPFITSKVYIPKYGHAESLNVGIATAIVCDRIQEKLRESP